MRLTILQSNYIPWKGYFDLMAMSDVFVVYDSVQYTKNDWRNRNMIASASGPIWLTIPVATSGRAEQRINEATINDQRWAKKHWSTIAQTFARRPHFAAVRERWESEYVEAQTCELLHDVNVRFLRMLASQLAIGTEIVDDRDFELEPDTPTGKLVQLCRLVGADRYVTGPAGLNYLEVERFHQVGIALDVIDYGHYPEYPQTTDEFRHGVSVLDLIASVGDEAASHLMGRYTTIEPLV
jgi:hypothetical protein